MSLLSLITGSFHKTHSSDFNFVEEKSYEMGFAEHYNTHIKQEAISFENRRIDALKIASSRIRISVVLFVIVFIIALYILILGANAPDDFKAVRGDDVKLILYIIFGAFSIAWWWVNRSIKAYSLSVKEKVFPNILSFLGHFKYLPQCSARICQLKDFDIIPDYDRETNEDRIVGKYKDVKIDLFETKLETKHRTKNGHYYRTKFKGVAITLSMHKKFKGKTVVVHDRGRLGNWLKNRVSGTENVKLEDPHFESMFEVYSDDQIEARYLLTTSFMERLVQLSEFFGGTGVECSFYNNKLFIMISVKKDLFEPCSIYEVEDFIDDSKSLLKEMNMIFEIIDILKLHYNIGM